MLVERPHMKERENLSEAVVMSGEMNRGPLQILFHSSQAKVHETRASRLASSLVLPFETERDSYGKIRRRKK